MDTQSTAQKNNLFNQNKTMFKPNKMLFILACFIFAHNAYTAQHSFREFYFMFPHRKDCTIIKHSDPEERFSQIFFIPAGKKNLYIAVRTIIPGEPDKFEKITNLSSPSLDPLFNFAVVRKPEHRISFQLLSGLHRKKQNPFLWEHIPVLRRRNLHIITEDPTLV